MTNTKMEDERDCRGGKGDPKRLNFKESQVNIQSFLNNHYRNVHSSLRNVKLKE